MADIWKVSTTLYVSARAADTAGKDAVVGKLRAAGWAVTLADVSPRPNAIGNAYGNLAEDQPADFWISKSVASKVDAEKAVATAILDTNNYSVAGKVQAAAVAVTGAVTDIANGKENPTVTKALSAVELVAFAVGALAVAYVAFQLAPLMRKAA